MNIEITELVETEILSGAPSGRELLAQLLTKLPEEPDEPEAIFLDFSNVKVATASFLRESVLAYRDLVRGRGSNFYPIIANPNQDVCDEIIETVHSRSGAIFVCCTDDGGRILRGRTVGNLKPKQKIAYDLVNKYKETDAVELMEQHQDTEQQTVWNNRLKSLSKLGLIFEIGGRRPIRYRSILAGVA